MSKFKEEDWVCVCNGQFLGQIMVDNEDGTYLVGYDEGNCGGSMTVSENDMELTQEPDYRVIPSMSIIEFTDNINIVLEQMYKEHNDDILRDSQFSERLCSLFFERYSIDTRC
jgi:hypothetical protein